MTETAEVQVPQRECDLVMKGGITSGVVYPTAIRKIAAEYHFRNFGGASAGAIAAVAAAACEFRRNNGVEDAFDALGEVGAEISQEGFVQNLSRDFNEYVGAGVLGGTSHLYHLAATHEFAPAVTGTFAAPLYTADDREPAPNGSSIRSALDLRHGWSPERADAIALSSRCASSSR